MYGRLLNTTCRSNQSVVYGKDSFVVLLCHRSCCWCSTVIWNSLIRACRNVKQWLMALIWSFWAMNVAVFMSLPHVFTLVSSAYAAIRLCFCKCGSSCFRKLMNGAIWIFTWSEICIMFNGSHWAFDRWSRISIGLSINSCSVRGSLFTMMCVVFFLSKLSICLIFQTALLKIFVSCAFFSSMLLNMRHVTPHTMRLSHQSASGPSIPTVLPHEIPSTRSSSQSPKTWETCEYFAWSGL